MAIHSLEEFVDKYVSQGVVTGGGIDLLAKRVKRWWESQVGGYRLWVTINPTSVTVEGVHNTDYAKASKRERYSPLAADSLCRVVLDGYKYGAIKCAWKSIPVFRAQFVRNSTEATEPVSIVRYDRYVHDPLCTFTRADIPVEYVFNGHMSDVMHRGKPAPVAATEGLLRDARRLIEGYVCSSTPELNDYSRLEKLLGFEAGRLFPAKEPIEVKPLLENKVNIKQFKGRS